MDTGIIQGRDIAVLLEGLDTPMYLTPFKYVLGNFLVQTPREIRGNLKKFDIDEEEFVKAVVKRETSKNVLNYGQFLPDSIPNWKSRRAVQNFKSFNGKYTANVKSSAKKGKKLHRVRFQNPVTTQKDLFAFKEIYCDCDDHFWSGVKPAPLMCRHLTPLEIILSSDKKNNLPVDKSLSGLIPPAYPSMPFDIVENDELIYAALKSYYLEGESQFNLNKSLLNTLNNYSSTLKNEVSQDRARFMAIRQDEKKIDNSKLEREDLAYHQAVLDQKKQVSIQLKKGGFSFAGYGVEFMGTPFETISYRYEKPNRSVVYSLCINDNLPPLLVKRFLDERSENWADANDKRTTHPILRVGQQYNSVDFTTRREAKTEIIIPDTKNIVLLNAYEKAIQ